ncbi:ThiF family adenylyltransferase, partial [Salmonella enterica subsp. diarizonae serovar 61:k:1,5,(7)]|nr:ThiF family adenylyltransferase [Salmonella enterica]EBH8064008.1 ThiF family adenylyltransferase [Salmonella bongori]ECC1739633.1 ThiF family adenylyltransferase [Salmonella enterica subsp. diarizonae]ECT4112230.1 ThiF family adenylyltransferase [Salmonella enterica subsp. diarizonae serovar 61:k:1,5,(7)]EDC5277133.1 ThiF family adenylyltransferase [Salmonella enterica subsp. enterica]
MLIDFDEIEFKNLNRIVNSTIEDARNRVTKVASIADALTTYRDDIEVIAI